MKTPYEPYKVDSLLELMRYAHNLGNYSGTKTLFNIKCIGAFEGFSGRATETRETKYIVTSDEINLPSKVIPAMMVEGNTLEEACSKMLFIVKS